MRCLSANRRYRYGAQACHFISSDEGKRSGAAFGVYSDSKPGSPFTASVLSGIESGYRHDRRASTPPGTDFLPCSLTLQDGKLSVKAEADVADFFLDIEGKTAQSITAGDKAAQIKTADASTSFSYAGTDPIEKAGDYLILSLPDYPFSAVHHTGISENDRDILLTLPAAFDETYTYQVHLGGKTLCTPATDLKLDNSVGSVEINIHAEGDGANVKRTLKLNKSRINPKEYPAYTELMKAWGDLNYTRLLVK